MRETPFEDLVHFAVWLKEEGHDVRALTPDELRVLAMKWWELTHIVYGEA